MRGSFGTPFSLQGKDLRYEPIGPWCKRHIIRMESYCLLVENDITDTTSPIESRLKDGHAKFTKDFHQLRKPIKHKKEAGVTL